MSAQITAYLRSNALGLVAIFIALAGTAVALPGKNTVDSGDIVNGEVKGGDLKDQVVGSAKLAADAVDSSKIASDSVTGADVDEGTLAATILQRRVSGDCPSGQAIRQIALDGAVTCQAPAPVPPSGPAGGELAGTYPNPQIAFGAVNSAKVVDGSLTDADVSDQSTLGGPEINEASLDGVGETARTTGALTSCDPPNSGQEITCKTLQADILQRNRALAIATFQPHTADFLSEVAFCTIYHGTSSVATEAFVISQGDMTGPITLVGVTSPSGSNALALKCSEGEGGQNITIQEPRFTVFGA